MHKSGVDHGGNPDGVCGSGAQRLLGDMPTYHMFNADRSGNPYISRKVCPVRYGAMCFGFPGTRRRLSSNFKRPKTKRPTARQIECDPSGPLAPVPWLLGFAHSLRRLGNAGFAAFFARTHETPNAVPLESCFVWYDPLDRGVHVCGVFPRARRLIRLLRCVLVLVRAVF